MTINSLSSTRRQVGAECLLLDSGAQLHACPIKYPGQRVPLPDPAIHTASGARLQYDGGRSVRFKLPEGRTIRVLFHACDVQKPSLSGLSCSAGVLCGPNQFERIRGFLKLCSRFEFGFRRCGNFFERFEFLVCSKFNHTQRDCTCACAVALLHQHKCISTVVVSVTIHDDTHIYIHFFRYMYMSMSMSVYVYVYVYVYVP